MVKELECHGSFKFAGLLKPAHGSIVRRLFYHLWCRRTDILDQVTLKGSSRCWLTRPWVADTFLFAYMLSLLLRYATEDAYVLILVSGKLLQVVCKEVVGFNF